MDAFTKGKCGRSLRRDPGDRCNSSGRTASPIGTPGQDKLAHLGLLHGVSCLGRFCFTASSSIFL